MQTGVVCCSQPVYSVSPQLVRRLAFRCRDRATDLRHVSTCRVLQTVGLLNYKAFLLFLAYTMLAAALATALLLRSFIDFFREGDIEDITR